MSVKSGALGVVNGVDSIRNWNTSDTAGSTPIWSSSTNGGPVRLAGNRDWSGGFSQYVFQPSIVPGQFFTFRGSVDGSSGVTSEDNGTICDSITVSADIAGALAIATDVVFSGSGTLTEDNTGASDISLPCTINSVGSYVTLETTGDDTSEGAIDDVQSWNFTILRNNIAYNSSSTAGQTLRLKGNLDATCSISILESDLDAVIEANSEYIVRFYEASGTFWQFSSIRFFGDGGFTVDREGPAAISYTLNGGFTGIYSAPGTAGCEEGTILMPDGTTLWPE